MGAASIAEVVCDQRGVFHDLATVIIFAIEAAQRIDVRALKAVLAHLVAVVEDERPHLLTISRAASGISHGIDRKAQPTRVKAKVFVELHQHDDALGVGSRI